MAKIGLTKSNFILLNRASAKLQKRRALEIWLMRYDNVDAADRFLEAAYGTFQDLARMPGMGRTRTFPQARLNNLRSFRIKDFENHLIFYGPIQDGIEVFHVLHGARDLEQF